MKSLVSPASRHDGELAPYGAFNIARPGDGAVAAAAAVVGNETEGGRAYRCVRRHLPYDVRVGVGGLCEDLLVRAAGVGDDQPEDCRGPRAGIERYGHTLLLTCSNRGMRHCCREERGKLGQLSICRRAQGAAEEERKQ